MCVLCEKGNLRLLTAPLATLSHRQLADSVALAREAAWQIVLDTADAIAESADTDACHELGPEGYFDYIVDRAERDGVLGSPDLEGWQQSLRDATIYRDPRVQAFLSSASEGLAAYILQMREHKEALELFLEERSGGVVFAGIGVSGEIIFDRASERYVVLTEEEGLRIAMDRLADDLFKEDPRWLLEYTNLPTGAADVLAAMQQGPPDRANDILAGIVDMHALTEDRVRDVGFAPFVAEGVTEEFSEQRFGDRIIIRLRMPEQPLLD